MTTEFQNGGEGVRRKWLSIAVEMALHDPRDGFVVIKKSSAVGWSEATASLTLYPANAVRKRAQCSR